jgi:uncharacterized Zn-finger protein
MTKELSKEAVLLQSKGPISITSEELPFSCPRPNAPLWSLHPKVYLPLEETGHETCPYCGTEYKLVE